MKSPEFQYRAELQSFYMGIRKTEPRVPKSLKVPWFNLKDLKTRAKEYAEECLKFQKLRNSING